MLFGFPTLPEKHALVVERVDRLRNRLRFLLQGQPRRWTGLLRRSTFARAIQGSNSIEGYHVTVDDAVAAVDGEEPLAERTEAWKAVTGYRNAMSYVLALADDAYYQHNEGTLKSLHYMMLSYDVGKHPGRWRPGSVYVRREPDNAIVYEGPSADRVPELMSELMTSLNAASPLPAMVRAALAHLNLVMVHPFSDGNGRMARALQSFVLARESIFDPTFSSIEEYLGHHTPAYYDVLAQVGQGGWHPENDPLPFVTFCLTAHYRQAEKLLQRTDEMARLWTLLEAQTQRRGLHERTMLALSDAALGFRVRNATYRTAAEISDPLASRDLRAMVDAGLLVPHGERRGRHYLASEWLRNARDQTRAPTVTTDPFSGEVVRVEPEVR
ncbi:MAG: Fic family protein [Steroidobacteraceae bacterium]|nr:Fic family protein [Steroidobacteraceae bacterium]MBP7014865.1 Fic family protein [Steroidobacteraceae bacterium]